MVLEELQRRNYTNSTKRATTGLSTQRLGFSIGGLGASHQ